MADPITGEELDRIRKVAEDPDPYYEGEITHALQRLMVAFDEAVKLANEYYFDIRQHVGDYQWEKHWASDRKEYPWLKEVSDMSRGSGSG